MPRTAHRGLGTRLAARPALEPVPGWYLGFGQSANIATRFRKKIWRLFRDPFQVSWLEGLRLTLIPGDETSRSVFVTGRYEPNEFCLLSRLLKPGMTFIDIGANVGLYTLFAAHRVGESGCVLAIEPSAREMQILKDTVEQNALRKRQVLSDGSLGSGIGGRVARRRLAELRAQHAGRVWLQYGSRSQGEASDQAPG